MVRLIIPKMAPFIQTVKVVIGFGRNLKGPIPGGITVLAARVLAV